MRRDPIQKIESAADVCAAPLWLEEKNFANDAQHVTAAFPRRHELLHFIRKENQSDLVIVPNGREGKDGANLRCEFPLRLLAGTEETGAAEIDHQHEREFTL